MILSSRTQRTANRKAVMGRREGGAGSEPRTLVSWLRAQHKREGRGQSDCCQSNLSRGERTAPPISGSENTRNPILGPMRPAGVEPLPWASMCHAVYSTLFRHETDHDTLLPILKAANFVNYFNKSSYRVYKIKPALPLEHLQSPQVRAPRNTRLLPLL